MQEFSRRWIHCARRSFDDDMLYGSSSQGARSAGETVACRLAVEHWKGLEQKLWETTAL